MIELRDGVPMADFDISDHARKVRRANVRLHAALGGELPSQAALDILLFLLAEDRGEGVTTSRCCGAVQVPRTTALRWIGTLVAADLIAQLEDESDRRLTLLCLTPRAAIPLRAWLEEIARPAAG